MELTIEVHLAQRLACNQSRLSDKALKKVGKWLSSKSVNKDAFTEDSLLKLWKGLFYYFWNADKPLVQEEKADIICSYIAVFKTVDCAFVFIDTFFQTMAREWLGIDRYRLEKFMMLIRKFLHQTYQLLKQLNWELKWIKRFRKVMKKTVLSSVLSGVSGTTPLGLKLHICDIYMDELAKVGDNELTHEILHHLLVPYCRILIECDDYVLLKSIKKDVFLYLVNQNADERSFHKFPYLHFDADAVQSLLMKFASKDGVRKQNMQLIYGIIKEFEDYKNGISAFDKIFSDKRPTQRLKKRDYKRAADRIFKDEVAYSEEKRQYKKKKFKPEDNVIDL